MLLGGALCSRTVLVFRERGPAQEIAEQIFLLLVASVVRNEVPLTSNILAEIVPLVEKSVQKQFLLRGSRQL